MSAMGEGGVEADSRQERMLGNEEERSWKMESEQESSKTEKHALLTGRPESASSPQCDREEGDKGEERDTKMLTALTSLAH